MDIAIFIFQIYKARAMVFSLVKISFGEELVGSETDTSLFIYQTSEMTVFVLILRG